MVRLAKSKIPHFILVVTFLLLAFFPSVSQAETMGVKNRIKALLPKNSMLRDYEQIPNMDKYLVIYITDPEIEEHEPDTDYSTCPPLVHGQPIYGEYHLALYDDGYFINDVTIPWNSSWEMKIVYRQPEGNVRRRSFEEMYPDKDEPFRMKRVKLLTFSDLTGDGLPHQFQIEVFGGSCGHASVLTAGYSKKEDKAVIYPIKGRNPFRPYYWHDNFYPNENGEFTWELRCGDHGNGTYKREKFEFDKDLQAYVLEESEKTPCEEKRDWW
ncbi:hypothetical protein KGY79_09000 [Candidatus Bipolaricaulota bacterium]|nr:hypothetical protein [Candidatus Bipolaricaulota bacterium]